ncbi:MAG: hypothetical protein JWQ88_3562 [Rhodoferax sp.]|jgi:hypothetical protein|nr:hypothetical protein [Rhodoferax sp.]
MSLVNQHWIGFGGEPVTGMTPTNVQVTSEPPGLAMNPTQEAAVAHAYKLFCTAVANSAHPGMYHAQHRTFPDGTTLAMTSHQGRHTVRAKIHGGPPRLLRCPGYLSGLMLDGWNAARMNNATPPVEVIDTLAFYPSMQYANGGNRGAQALPMYPEMKDETHGADWRKFHLPFLTPLRTPVDLSPPAPWTRYTPVPQVAYIRPGMYSGTMRSVIQYMLGAKTPIKFGYHHHATHGIANVPSDDGPIPWVIEISAQFGVLASRLKLCSKKDPLNPLGYTPLGSDLPCPAAALPALLEAGKVIRLLRPEDLAGFYNGGGIFPECGWAFSYTGLEAQNTALGSAGNYQATWRYKVVIHHANGAPTSASATQEDSGLMVGKTHLPGQLFVRSQVRIPSYALQGNITLSMMPLANASFDVKSICPIYVYYDGDTPQYVKWVNEVPEVDPDYDFPPWSTFNPDETGSYNKPYAELGSMPAVRGKIYQIESPVHPAASVYIHGERIQTRTPLLYLGFKSYCFMPPNGAGFANNMMYSMTAFCTRDVMVEGAGTGMRHTVTIPLYEREMIYHMTEEMDMSDAETYAFTNYTRMHANVDPFIYFFGKKWDPVLQAEETHYTWEMLRSYGSLPYNGNPGPGGLTDGLPSNVFPGGLFGSTFTNDSPAGPVVAVPNISTPPKEGVTNDTQELGLTVTGSRFGQVKLPFGPEHDYTRWFLVSPDPLAGWTSRMWVARSANGLHVVPKKEYDTSMQGGDFLLDLGSYDSSMAFAVPWLAFLGNAEDKPGTPVKPPPNYPKTFTDPTKP